MTRPFKPGDRVRVFGVHFIHGWSEQIDGTVTRVQDKPVSRVWIKCDVTDGEVMAVPKQCRRLKRRELRRIWLDPNDAGGSVWRHGASPVYSAWTTQDYGMNGWIEFREVQRRRK